MTVARAAGQAAHESVVCIRLESADVHAGQQVIDGVRIELVGEIAMRTGRQDHPGGRVREIRAGFPVRGQPGGAAGVRCPPGRCS